MTYETSHLLIGGDYFQGESPRDFFPPCRAPGAQFSLGTSLNDSDCSHWEKLSGGITRLPWVASRKPEERILEVEKYPRDLQMFQHTSLALISV